MTEREAQRVDKWLWHARFARTRSAAQQLAVEPGGRAQPAHEVGGGVGEHGGRVGTVPERPPLTRRKRHYS